MNWSSGLTFLQKNVGPCASVTFGKWILTLINNLIWCEISYNKYNSLWLLPLFVFVLASIYVLSAHRFYFARTHCFTAYFHCLIHANILSLSLSVCVFPCVSLGHKIFALVHLKPFSFSKKSNKNKMESQRKTNPRIHTHQWGGQKCIWFLIYILNLFLIQIYISLIQLDIVYQMERANVEANFGGWLI